MSPGLLACLLLASCQPHGQMPPTIPTAGLDPAVAGLIESTLSETRAARSSGAAWGRLGSVLMHYEFVDEASAAFDHAARLSPAEPRWPYLHSLLLQSRDPSAALLHLRRAVALVNSESRSSKQPDAPTLRLAQVLAERGEGTEAAFLFNELLRANPDNFPARLGLARLDWSAALLATNAGALNSKFKIQGAEFAGCLTDPHTAKSAHLLLATMQQAQGDATAAAETSRKAASLPQDTPWPDPWWSETLAFRVGKKARMEDATALMEQGHLAEAAEILAGVTRDYPTDEDGWYQSGWALNQTGQFAAAERALRQHLTLAPQSPKGYAQLAVALLAQKRYLEAIPVLEAALALKPGWRELHSNLGFACVQLGRDGEAVMHFRNALLNDPNYMPTYTALAELLRRRGEREEARRLLQRALETSPDDAKVRAMLRHVE